MYRTYMATRVVQLRTTYNLQQPSLSLVTVCVSCMPYAKCTMQYAVAVRHPFTDAAMSQLARGTTCRRPRLPDRPDPRSSIDPRTARCRPSLRRLSSQITRAAHCASHPAPRSPSTPACRQRHTRQPARPTRPGAPGHATCTQRWPSRGSGLSSNHKCTCRARTTRWSRWRDRTIYGRAARR